MHFLGENRVISATKHGDRVQQSYQDGEQRIQKNKG